MLHVARRILAIDDDSGVRANIAAYLEDSGYTVLEAENGVAGLDAFTSGNPDIILVDLWMPVMDGREFLKRIRMIAPKVPVIVVSGIGVLEDAVEALRQGAWDYVTKPINDMRVLEHTIKKCFERADLLEEREQYQERLEAEVRERTRELERSNANLREYQNLILEKNQLQQALLENIPNSVFYTTLDGMFIGCNQSFASLAGAQGPANLTGRKVEAVLEPAMASAVNCDDAGVGEDIIACREVRIPVNDKLRDMLVYKSLFRDRNGAPAGVVGSFHDITELKEQEARIIYQATHDELTGLLNRTGMRDYVASLIRQSGNSGGFSLFWVDIDDFKTVNDSLGHAIGDQVLCEVGQRILSTVGGKAVVGRAGSDEFLVLSPDHGTAGAAQDLAHILLEAFADVVFVAGHEVYIQPCIGYCLYPDDAPDADLLIRNADLAMYRAKEHGNRSGRFDATMLTDVTRRLELGKKLRKGMESAEFVLHYQPKVRAEDNAIAGMEALIRWRTQEGYILPGEFVPVAEDTGLIIAMGEWGLREACRAQRRFAAKGLDLVMAANISARQFQANLPAVVSQILRETEMPPSRLELEITESAMMRDLDASVAALRSLKRLGVRIAIDDFGTGHSSLFYLKNFPVDTLKIDKSFVSDVCKDPHDSALVASIISMAKNLGLDIVAEGVETREQQDFLRDAGCTEMQGYYFNPAVPEDDFYAFAIRYGK